MRSRSLLPLFAGLMATDPNFARAKIPSHKIEAKEEAQQLSKQKLQKLKGKKNRKNRERNRK